MQTAEGTLDTEIGNSEDGQDVSDERGIANDGKGKQIGIYIVRNILTIIGQTTTRRVSTQGKLRIKDQAPVSVQPSRLHPNLIWTTKTLRSHASMKSTNLARTNSRTSGNSRSRSRQHLQYTTNTQTKNRMTLTHRLQLHQTVSGVRLC